MALHINILKKMDENVLVFQLKGSLDTETHLQLLSKVSENSNASVSGIVLDLRDLEYISSMGISAIIKIEQAMLDINASLAMINIPAHIDEVFRIVKALPNIRIFESVEEADRYFLEIQQQVKSKRPGS